MTAQSLQVASPEDALAGLGIITNGIISVNVVFRVEVAGRRRLPVFMQGLRVFVPLAWNAPGGILLMILARAYSPHAAVALCSWGAAPG